MINELANIRPVSPAMNLTHFIYFQSNTYSIHLNHEFHMFLVQMERKHRLSLEVMNHHLSKIDVINYIHQNISDKVNLIF